MYRRSKSLQKGWNMVKLILQRLYLQLLVLLQLGHISHMTLPHLLYPCLIWLLYLYHLCLQTTNLCSASTLSGILGISAHCRQLSGGNSDTVTPHATITFWAHQFCIDLSLDATGRVGWWWLSDTLWNKICSSFLYLSQKINSHINNLKEVKLIK